MVSRGEFIIFIIIVYCIFWYLIEDERNFRKSLNRNMDLNYNIAYDNFVMLQDRINENSDSIREIVEANIIVENKTEKVVETPQRKSVAKKKK